MARDSLPVSLIDEIRRRSLVVGRWSNLEGVRLQERNQFRYGGVHHIIDVGVARHGVAPLSKEVGEAQDCGVRCISAVVREEVYHVVDKPDDAAQRRTGM